MLKVKKAFLFVCLMNIGGWIDDFQTGVDRRLTVQSLSKESGQVCCYFWQYLGDMTRLGISEFDVNDLISE